MAGPRVTAISTDDLTSYASISNSFRVESVVVTDRLRRGVAGATVAKLPVSHPYVKEYQREDPLTWAPRYPDATWGLFGAYDGDVMVGGAAVVTPEEGMVVPAGRSDVAVLWDLRVMPSDRRRGIGRLLVTAAADWARDHGFAVLGIETQDINVPACRLYSACGCSLVRVVDDGYAGSPDVAHEKMLVWNLSL